MEDTLSYKRATPPIGHAMLHDIKDFPMIPARVAENYVYTFPPSIETSTVDSLKHLSGSQGPTVLSLPQAIMLMQHVKENLMKNPSNTITPQQVEEIDRELEKAKLKGHEMLEQCKDSIELFYPLKFALHIGNSVKIDRREKTLISAWVHRDITVELRDKNSLEDCRVTKVIFKLKDVLSDRMGMFFI